MIWSSCWKRIISLAPNQVQSPKTWTEKVAIHCNFAVVICILKHLQLDEYIFFLHWFGICNSNSWIEIREMGKMAFLVPDISTIFFRSFLKINHFIFTIHGKNGLFTKITNNCGILQYHFTYFDSPKSHYDSDKKWWEKKSKKKKKRNWIDLFRFLRVFALSFISSSPTFCSLFTHQYKSALFALFSFLSEFFFHEPRTTFQRVKMNETFQRWIEAFHEIL